jgi:hypothetical protein
MSAIDNKVDLAGRQQYLSQLRSNIPQEMQRFNQWCLWASFADKKPRRCSDPSRQASVTDPMSWSSFEEAIHALEMFPTIAGIGFVFSDSDPYTGIDIDAKEKPSPERAQMHDGIREALVEKGESYCERSPSGVGFHVIVIGHLTDADGWKPKGLQIEVYSTFRFFTFTGAMYDPKRTAILDGQRFINDFQAWVPSTTHSAKVDVEDTTVGGRRLDLSDEQVLQIAWQIAGFAERYNRVWHKKCGWDWSGIHVNLIGDLDMITGRAAQVKQLVYHSPLVQNSEPSDRGEIRIRKCERTFDDALLMARGKNSSKYSPMFKSHGAEIIEALEQGKQERAEEWIRKVKPSDLFLRDVAGVIGPECLQLHVPHSVLGQFVEAIKHGTHHPSNIRALPVALSFLSGILGRRYKIKGKLGLNSYWIMTAISGTGKSDAVSVLEGLVAETEIRLTQGVLASARQGATRLINSNAASIQGLGDKFSLAPSFLWLVDESKAQLRNMMNDHLPTGVELRSAVSKIYDASQPAGSFNLPVSRATARSGFRAISNLNMSILFVMTPDELAGVIQSVTNGFMSRAILVQAKDSPSLLHDPVPMDLYPQWLKDRLRDLMAHADELDDSYLPNSGRAINLHYVSLSAEAEQIRRDMMDLVQSVTDRIVSGELSDNYTVLNRLVVNGLKIAGTLAAVENPWINVTIQGWQLRWALGYVAQNLADVLDDLESGVIGETASDEVKAVVRFFKEELLRRKKVMRKVVSMPKRELQNMCKDRLPFKNNTKNKGPTALAGEVIKWMSENGMFSIASNGDLMATDDPVWM